jgi:predicted dinucleotide-binding enzyme
MTIGIIGAGAIGAAIARTLARAGIEATIATIGQCRAAGRISLCVCTDVYWTSVGHGRRSLI